MTRTLHASVAGAGLLPGQFIAAAADLLLPTDDIVVPDLFRQEALSVIFKAERRGRLTRTEGDGLRTRLQSLRCSYLPSVPYLDRAYDIALRFRQSDIYDAVYLVCADDVGGGAVDL